MKAIISGSIAFQTEYQELIQKFEQAGIQVIDYPRLGDDLDQEYPMLLKEFFRHIEEADIFLLYNKKKKGIAGYIGPSGFSELTYALMQNLIHGKNIRIFLWEEPSPENSCYEEVSRWIDNQWVEFYSKSILQENNN
ncbi:hypothetical protein JZO70_21875 [Enterococcus sp. 669A]|uniref:Nucleoside 2-deoxyribosyltransferase n=1 Tax=Candidatus Enterococcus moelleringii TaxID=2815325 RepID=A0ABS3LJE5_9ENTE|nr:hypothetical protein [Enterococcus sp. 669A]MBO1308836.1 hypothetical protein [Enterococcus sp. 669A]